ncbi:MAG: UDP-N-acetylmuramate dehydrogenase [Candidatus Parcubacteria bacterium]|jgi:UDP-N-acetylmuramate dehydrogenase
MNIQENVLLKDLSTFKIGGKVKYVVFAETNEDIVQALRFSQERSLPIGVIGAGCNLLITDDDLEALVIKMNTREIHLNNTLVFADAGLSLAALTAFGHKNNLVGLEWAPSVPSSVGGAIRGNAGAFGGETKDRLKQVRIYRDGQIIDIDSDDLDFQYRYSSFKSANNKDIILGGTFELDFGNIQESQIQVRNNIIRKNQNQPVGVACSGCIFKNYEGPIDMSLIDKFPEISNFVSNGIIPSGYLIENSGLKGVNYGGIQISSKHANYMINTGNGTFSDVMNLIQIVKDKVYEVFGVIIEEEVVYFHQQIKKI